MIRHIAIIIYYTQTAVDIDINLSSTNLFHVEVFTRIYSLSKDYVLNKASWSVAEEPHEAA